MGQKDFPRWCATFFLMLCLIGGAAQSQDLEKGKQLYYDNNLDEAKEIFENLIQQNPRNWEAVQMMGLVHYSKDNDKECVQWLERARALNDTVSETHRWLGNIYGRRAQRAGLLKKAGWAKKMKKAYERSIELDADNVRARFALTQFYLFAPGIMGGSKEKAAIQVQEIKNRDTILGHRAFIMLYDNQKKFDLAEKEFSLLENFVGDSVEHASFYNDYGYYLLRRNKVDEAIEKFEKQVQLSPDEANAYDSLGDGYRAASRWEEAASAYRQAIEISPGLESSTKKLKEVEKEIKELGNTGQ